MTEEKALSDDKITEAYRDLVKLWQQGDPGSLTLVIGIILLLMPFLSYPFISSGVLHAGWNGHLRYDFFDILQHK